MTPYCKRCEALMRTPDSPMVPEHLVELQARQTMLKPTSPRDWDRPAFYECLECRTIWVCDPQIGWTSVSSPE